MSSNQNVIFNSEEIYLAFTEPSFSWTHLLSSKTFTSTHVVGYHHARLAVAEIKKSPFANH